MRYSTTFFLGGVVMAGVGLMTLFNTDASMYPDMYWLYIYQRCTGIGVMMVGGTCFGIALMARLEGQ